METKQVLVVYVLLAVALVYGVSFVMPIGGADMPVVISLLNSLTGIAAAMAGFIYQNQAMILGGIFVGAAGMILTLLMCKAMNRSLINVIIGAFGGGGAGVDREKGVVKEVTGQTDAAVMLNYSSKVVIVPGYGLAVAQAQHICSELDELLEANGVEVKYAIHPVAGRMPGHMNVLAGGSRCAL
jgi:NAD(P) transhydrogenase subunit beta